MVGVVVEVGVVLVDDTVLVLDAVVEKGVSDLDIEDQFSIPISTASADKLMNRDLSALGMKSSGVEDRRATCLRKGIGIAACAFWSFTHSLSKGQYDTAPVVDP